MSNFAQRLKLYSIQELDELYCRRVELVLPRHKSFRGHVLKRFDNPGAVELWNTISQMILFELIPFGINFYNGTGDWFFFDPGFSTGDFEMRTQNSRWRYTESIGFYYHNADLPAFIKQSLYDEIKPVGDGHYLGIGGINAEKDRGDHFYFLLEPIE